MLFRSQRQARTLVERYFDDPASLPPTLVSAMLQVAAAGGDAPLYDRYLARMQASLSTPEEYYRYFNALAAFRTPALRARTMELALSKEVRTQDTSILLAQLLTSRSGQDEAWAYIKGHWPAVVDKVGSFQGMPTLAGALAAFCSADKSTDIKAFFDAHPLPEVATREHGDGPHKDERDVHQPVERRQPDVGHRNRLRVYHLGLDVERREIRQDVVGSFGHRRRDTGVQDLLEVPKVVIEVTDDPQPRREHGGQEGTGERREEEGDCGQIGRAHV